LVKRAARSSAKPFRWRPLAALALLLAALAGLYFAIVWLGDRSRANLADRARYKVNFFEIECSTPPGLSRAAFLAEVQYITNAPQEWSKADEAMPARLAALFAKHPWVKSATPRAALDWPSPVALEFRVPFLAVKTAGELRAIDRDGAVLPKEASNVGLPIFETEIALPAAGDHSTHADILRAIQIAKDHPAKLIEKTPQGWRITLRNGQMLRLP
jgi:hypothetical protein